MSTTGSQQAACDNPLPTIMLFGQGGVGKSSIINMLAGSGVAHVSNSAGLVTLSSTSYTININDSPYRIIDTPGIEADDRGDPDTSAIIDLIRDHQRDLGLQIFCMRRGRITEADEFIYRSCSSSSKIPIFLVITDMDDGNDLESWWKSAEKSFAKHKMTFCGHAGVVLRSDNTRYEQSKDELKSSVKKHCLALDEVMKCQVSSGSSQNKKRGQGPHLAWSNLKQWWKDLPKWGKTLIVIGGVVLVAVIGVIIAFA
ncbi:P-loop containing nucleoside triphosphate hydrolase protein [Mycena floridula]|nr:P-loop containing nucleoside triphosphate hydrolase protein [Mycena floridula]